MGRFQTIQKGFYDDLGVIVRLTQPVKIGNSTETTFSGTILTTVTVEAPGEGGTVEMTFDNVILDNAAQALINSAKADELTVAQLNSLIDLATSVEYDPTTLKNATYASVTKTTVDEDFGYNQFLVTFTAKFGAHEELATGAYDLGSGTVGGHYAMDADGGLHGTHEFSYAE